MADSREDAVMEDEEEVGCESSRGKESKFSIERSGMPADNESVPPSGSNSAGAGSNSPSKGASAGSNGNKSINEDGAGGDLGSSDRKGNRGGRGSRVRTRIPDDFCRDFIFFTCERRDCKFKHPSADSQEYKDALASRPGWSSRDRSRSPLSGRGSSRSNDRSADHGRQGGGSSSGDKPTVCRDFLRNACYRGKDCRFYHPPDGDTEELPWPQLCLDYRTGNCKRFDCRFLHYSREDEDYYLRTGTIRKELWEHFVSITLKDTKILKNRPVCKGFLQNGQCMMDVCRYRHLTQKEYDDEIYHLMTRMVYEKCRRIRRDLPPPPPPSRRSIPNDMPPPPPPGPYDSPMPPPPGPGFREFDPIKRPPEGGRRDFNWDRGGAPPYEGYGGNKQDGPPPTVEQLTRENIDLRHMINEDNARYKADVERLKMDNAKLQNDMNFLKKNNPSGGAAGGGALQQQLSLVQQENTDLTNKMKGINDWSVELQAKYSTARRECDELRDSVKVLNLELATINEEKVKLKRKSDELEAKLQVAQVAKDEGSLAIEKKEYLESKVKQYYEGMKRCEAEFISNLEKNFNITTPQVMSYFPSWGYLMSFVTDIVTQINNNASTTTPQGFVTSTYNTGGNSIYAAGSSSTTSTFSLPPPSNVTSSAPPSGYGNSFQADYPTGQQYPQSHAGFDGSSNYYGTDASGGGYGGGGYNPPGGSVTGGYGNVGGFGGGGGSATSGTGHDKSRPNLKTGSKNAMSNPPPWKKRN